DDRRTGNELIVLPDHRHISESDVLNQVNSFSDFRNLLLIEDKANSFFQWTKVIDKVSKRITLPELNALIGIIKPGRKESSFYADLSGVALSLGDKRLAEDLAYKSLEYSSSSGWVKFYDGGTRLQAFEALRRISPEVSVDKA